MAGVDAGLPGEHGQQPEIATLVFNDGSRYTGTLKNGTPHGLGTCIWKDGNQYDGEWKNGVMHGFGTYLWTSGQRYDGEWKDGKRDGVGVKMYSDGSKFHGIWRDGKKHGVGVFKPATKEKDKDRAKQLGKTNSGRLGGPAYDGDSVTNLRTYGASAVPETASHADAHRKDGTVAPSTEVDISEDGVDLGRGREGQREKDREREHEREGKMVFIRAFEDGVLRREEKLSSEDAKMIFGQGQTAALERGRGSKARKKVKRALGFGKKLQEKHGQLLYKGMPGYNLMLRLQHGIRWSIGRGWYGQGELQQPQTSQHSMGGPIALSHVLKESDFTQKVKVFFPSAGSSITPAHPAGDFKWKDYSPRVFRNLRNMYGIADADYMLSLGGSSALWQLNSPGKSGCMFFLSDDERFLIKTMRKTEIKTLIDMLPKYYRHMETQPQNLVIRFFGVHGVKQVHGRTVRFVVMHNMFNTDLQIHKKFDLKGSTDGRTTGAKVDPNDPKTIFKDLDLDLQFLLEPPIHAALIRQIHSDAEFLRAVEVMDYSLLLGIHFCNRMRLAPDTDAPVAQGQNPVQQTDQSVPPRLAPPPPSTDGHGGAASSTSIPTSPPTATAAGRDRAQQASLLTMDSLEAEEAKGQRTSPRVSMPTISPGGNAPGRAGAGSGDDPEGDHIRNFDLFSDRPDLDKQLCVFEERMHGMSYSAQRIQDILSLARLRIVGDQLKKRSKKAYKVYDGPTTVLQALASRRHGTETLPRLDEADEPLSDDEADDAGGPGGKQPPNLGYQIRALAVHTRGDQPPEEVVLCFGIIDILQEWNTRKVLERTVKSFAHDSYAISVAPPKLYSIRFEEFLARNVFMEPATGAAKGLHLPSFSASMYGIAHGAGVTTIEEEQE